MIYTLIYRRPSDRDLYCLDISGAHSPAEAEQIVEALDRPRTTKECPRSCWARMVFPDGKFHDYEPGLAQNGAD